MSRTGEGDPRPPVRPLHAGGSAGLERIARGLRRGEHAALALIQQDLVPLLRAWLGRHMGSILDQAEVDDVLSEAVLRLWQTREHYDEDKPLLPWAQAIVRNLAFDVLRERKRRVPLEGEEQAPLVHPALHDDEGGRDRDDDPVTRSVSMPPRKRKAVLAAVDALCPEDLRILQVYVSLGPAQGSNHNWTRELSEELGISPGTLRVRKHRILNRIRRAVSDAEETEDLG